MLIVTRLFVTAYIVLSGFGHFHFYWRTLEEVQTSQKVSSNLTYVKHSILAQFWKGLGAVHSEVNPQNPLPVYRRELKKNIYFPNFTKSPVTFMSTCR